MPLAPTKEQDLIEHGGRLLQAKRRYPGAPSPFLDLSTGINPDAYDFTPPAPDAWRRLPEPEDVQALEAAAAQAYGVEDPACVVAAPGTQALIQLLPLVRPQHEVAILTPTYAEHEAAWSAAGTTVHRVAEVRGAAAILCNPNNPDGRRHDPAALAALAQSMDLLVVDEAFADFESGLSAAPLLPIPGLVILRSFGKAYGLAGLRLGFALTEPSLAARLRKALGPWAVSGPALAIGTQALTDADWRNAAAARALAASARLDAMLQNAGLSKVGGTALFQTAQTDDAAQVAAGLSRAGILVRHFDTHPRWLRFGLPADEPAWARLAAALRTAGAGCC